MERRKILLPRNLTFLHFWLRIRTEYLQKMNCLRKSGIWRSIGDIATVTVHIKKIREKIEFNTAKPQYIETIWGVGYRFKV